MCLTERKEKRRHRRRKHLMIRAISTFFGAKVDVERSGCYGMWRRSMMDPAAQGAGPIRSAACVDAKRLQCSTMPDGPISNVVDGDNTSSRTMPMTPLDDEDLLREILLRLPPKPSSFPRASLVCKQWSCVLSDPRFLRNFRKHHLKPLILGFFVDEERCQATVFTPMLDPPDRIPDAIFVLPENLLCSKPYDISFVGCRHGIALFLDRKRRQAILWDPLTGVQRFVAFPPRFRDDFIRSAALLCPDGDEQHMHLDCNMSPFKLVLAFHDSKASKPCVCTYESKSGVWGHIISTTTMTIQCISLSRPSVLVANALLWLLDGGDMVEFDFERLTLTVIQRPAGAHRDSGTDWSFQILRGEDNGLGLAILSRSKLSIQLWAWKSNFDGGVSWVLQDTVQLDELFSRPLRLGAQKLVLIPGYDEDTNVIFLSTASDDFILQLESRKLNYIGRREYKSFRMYYPYTIFYTAVRGAAGTDGGAKSMKL